MPQRSSAPVRPPLVRPGIRKIAYGLVAANVVFYGSLWLLEGLVAR